MKTILLFLSLFTSYAASADPSGDALGAFARAIAEQVNRQYNPQYYSQPAINLPPPPNYVDQYNNYLLQQALQAQTQRDLAAAELMRQQAQTNRGAAFSGPFQGAGRSGQIFFSNQPAPGFGR